MSSSEQAAPPSRFPLAPFDPSFLARLTYSAASLQFRALDDGPVPPFAGSSLRGAIGYALRDRFCQMQPACPVQCARPESCRFYACFSQDRIAPGAGANLPKRLILRPQPPAQLEAIALGGPVTPPYETAGPTLECPDPLWFRKGDLFPVRVVFIGADPALAGEIVAALAGQRLRIGQCVFTLAEATDTTAARAPLYLPDLGAPVQNPAIQDLAWTLRARETATRARIFLLTPLRIKTAKGYATQPAAVAGHLVESCLVRTMKLHDTFCAPPGTRLPFMTLPPPLRLAGSRLFLYRFHRRSFRLDRETDLEGMVGWFNLEGDLGPVLPLLRAAEVLQAGQNATFGFGQLRCVLF